jgi:hypothetical protein
MRSTRPVFLTALLLALFFVGLPAAHGGIQKRLIVTGAASADGVCGTNNDGAVIALVDASSVVDCDATGGGTTTAWCGCDSAVRGALGSAASALAANGANCSAGSYPLGVSASGAAESCTVANLLAIVEHGVTDVTVADDGAGTKPAGAIPITTDFATCTCNDATGCAMTIAEPTPTAGYGRELTIASVGTGNCEFADSSGVLEIGSAIVLEPTSAIHLAYLGAAWHRVSTADNVP